MTYSATMNFDGSPIWLRIAAVIGVIWYAFGLMQFWLGYSMDTGAAVTMGAITEQHGAAIAGTPGLIWLTFAIASAAGLAGSIFLFSRSALAKTLFTVSLASAAIYYGWVYLLSGTGADRPFEELIIASVVGSVTLGYVILSHRAT